MVSLDRAKILFAWYFSLDIHAREAVDIMVGMWVRAKGTTATDALSAVYDIMQDEDRPQ